MITAFLFGLISSLHCIGMCGPIAVMLPIRKDNSVKRVFQVSFYHLGRITSYSFLGFIFGLLGKGLYIAGLQQQVSIIVGVLMIAFVLIPHNKLGRLNFMKPLFSVVTIIKKRIGIQFKKQTYSSIYFLGLFNGFLPCGMVYVALFGALATQNIFMGILYMIFFGLGTVPLMSTLVFAQNWFTQKFRNSIMRYYPIIIVLFGMLFIIRGLGLNIPFLSPATLDLLITEEPNC